MLNEDIQIVAAQQLILQFADTERGADIFEFKLKKFFFWFSVVHRMFTTLH